MSSTILRTSLRRYATATSSPRSFIPPNIASPKAAVKPTAAPSGAAASDLSSVVHLYKNLPKGPAPVKPADIKTGIFGGYRAKYFAPGKESPKPLLHVIFLISGIGYVLAYNAHLSHHKNREHH
ncbi:mitochondrial F1-F0 ATP synthase subunit F of fungi-domain-containing protein [Paraphysoderma sedebokerense]|nr:mitochondrial F1-F0 ATP synthase subunit F of fungi-domain-containing protein [Paraphysoderma sedebokerense]